MPSPLLHALHSAPGPHPPLAELRAYAAGEVAGPAAYRLEAHTLRCARCADVLADLQQTDAARTDEALAELRQRLRLRVGEPGRSAGALPPPGHFRAWPRLAAAAALVAGLGAGIWGWQQHEQTPPKAELAVVLPAPPDKRGSAAAAASADLAAANVAEAAATPSPVAPASARRSPDNVAVGPQRPANSPTLRRPNLSASSPAETKYELEKTAAVAVAPPAPADEATASAIVVARAKKDIDADSRQLSEVVVSDAYAAPTVAQKAARAKAAVPAPATADAARFPSDTALPAGTVALVPLAAGGAARRPATMPPPPTLEPMPEGGYQALRKYLRKEAADFEPESGKLPLKGMVRVRLPISAAGKPEVDSAQVLRSLRADYDAEVLRMLAEGPAWIPGVAKGRRSPLPVQVEVVFE